MFRTPFLARSVARRSTAVQPTTAFTRQYAIGSKQPSTATTQSADSSIKTPSRPQSETADAQPSGMDSMPGSSGKGNSFSNADGSQHALKKGAESDEAREVVKGPLADAGVETKPEFK